MHKTEKAALHRSVQRAGWFQFETRWGTWRLERTPLKWFHRGWQLGQLGSNRGTPPGPPSSRSAPFLLGPGLCWAAPEGPCAPEGPSDPVCPSGGWYVGGGVESIQKAKGGQKAGFQCVGLTWPPRRIHLGYTAQKF